MRSGKLSMCKHMQFIGIKYQNAQCKLQSTFLNMTMYSHSYRESRLMIVSRKTKKKQVVHNKRVSYLLVAPL